MCHAILLVKYRSIGDNDSTIKVESMADLPAKLEELQARLNVQSITVFQRSATHRLTQEWKVDAHE